LQHDERYRDEFDAATEDAADILEAEAFRRAVEGWDEPTGWYRGQPGGTVRKYSDTLLIFLLKGMRPAKYRERTEVQGAFAHINLQALPDDLVRRLAEGEHPGSVLACLSDEQRRVVLPDHRRVGAGSDTVADCHEGVAE
jgi:hypothetical protein